MTEFSGFPMKKAEFHRQGMGEMNILGELRVAIH